MTVPFDKMEHCSMNHDVLKNILGLKCVIVSVAHVGNVALVTRKSKRTQPLNRHLEIFEFGASTQKRLMNKKRVDHILYFLKFKSFTFKKVTSVCFW